MHPYNNSRYTSLTADNKDIMYLPEFGTHMIIRPIEGTDRYDAISPYPFTSIKNNKGYYNDIVKLIDKDLVSATFILDPLDSPSIAELRPYVDYIKEFKTHYVYDYNVVKEYDYTAHHRLKVRKALKECEIRVIELSEYLNEWMEIYNNTNKVCEIETVHDKRHFRNLAYSTIKMLTVGAFIEDRLVSAHIWLFNGDYLYSHLSSSSDEGYAVGASYGIYDYTIKNARDLGIQKINFGGNPGTVDDPDNGVAYFKRGFSNSTVKSHIAGLILDDYKYHELSNNNYPDTYFPAYRYKDK